MLAVASSVRVVDQGGSVLSERMRRALTLLGYGLLAGACAAGAFYAEREISAIL
jgi:hypothetical protein